MERTSTMLEDLLEEQKTLTIVSRFAQKHARREGSSLHAPLYRDLIPLAAPLPGEQYAFEVDLDKCSGCKACVAACHSLNGLEEDESWRAVGLLVNDDSAAPFQQTVTTACHHCADPACMHGCPVLAYEKDPLTGIVHHLDDQCIGCQYCVMKCPYEVPRYSSRLGIVRKCDMCSNRLRAGEAPACVQSCPSEAIRISTVPSADLITRYQPGERRSDFLPAAPSPSYTYPATLYRSDRGLPERLRAADEQAIQPAAPHWPLVWMLLLTQASAGIFWMQSLVVVGGSWPLDSRLLVTVAALLGLAGITSSIFHLGRPLYAWRAFIGVGRSWLSREIVMFSAFALSVLFLLAVEVLPGFFPHWAASNVPTHLPAILAVPALLCSVLLYHDTRREFWHWKRTAPQFLGAALLLGSVCGLLLLPEHSHLMLLLAAIAGLFKLGTILSLVVHLSSVETTALKRSAILLTRELRPVFALRLVTLLPGIILPVGWMMRGAAPSPGSAALLVFILATGELAERYLFFRAVSQPKMPGGLP